MVSHEDMSNMKQPGEQTVGFQMSSSKTNPFPFYLLVHKLLLSSQVQPSALQTVFWPLWARVPLVSEEEPLLALLLVWVDKVQE